MTASLRLASLTQMLSALQTPEEVLPPHRSWDNLSINNGYDDYLLRGYQRNRR